VSVGAVPPGAAFLLSAAGPRRYQGRIIWIRDGAPIPHLTSAPHRFALGNLVRSAASRRLPLVGADEAGERAWRTAVARARRLTRGDGRLSDLLLEWMSFAGQATSLMCLPTLQAERACSGSLTICPWRAIWK
jgi:hypothetical protein